MSSMGRQHSTMSTASDTSDLHATPVDDDNYTHYNRELNSSSDITLQHTTDHSTPSSSQHRSSTSSSTHSTTNTLTISSQTASSVPALNYRPSATAAHPTSHHRPYQSKSKSSRRRSFGIPKQTARRSRPMHHSRQLHDNNRNRQQQPKSYSSSTGSCKDEALDKSEYRKDNDDNDGDNGNTGSAFDQCELVD